MNTRKILIALPLFFSLVFIGCSSKSEEESTPKQPETHTHQDGSVHSGDSAPHVHADSAKSSNSDSTHKPGDGHSH